MIETLLQCTVLDNMIFAFTDLDHAVHEEKSKYYSKLNVEEATNLREVLFVYLTERPILVRQAVSVWFHGRNGRAHGIITKVQRASNRASR